MKTTKSLLYGLLLVTGLAACSKEYNSDPATNGNAFGGSNPVAPISGAGTDEVVFKENGQIIRLKAAKYMDAGNGRMISGGTTSGTSATSYQLYFRVYKGAGIYNGSGKSTDSFYLVKQIGDLANPSAPNIVSFYSGAINKNINGYSYTNLTDTANNKMKGEFTGRLVRRDLLDLDKDFGEFIDITSGFYNASKFVP